jgi:hypothetical protein
MKNWMRALTSLTMTTLCAAALLTANGFGQSISSEAMAKVDAKIKQLQGWSTDPAIIGAVKSHNSSPPAEDAAMTNGKWAELTVIDPFVRSFAKNPLALYLKTKKDDQIAEIFVSGADGTKVAFLSKTTSWSHAGKDKHKVPMSGKTYTGPVAMDESTGQQLIQIGLPVIDGGKPIGSIVVGLLVSKL